MAMNRKQRRAHNLANLLLAVLVKKEPAAARENVEKMAKALETRANSRGDMTNDKDLKDHYSSFRLYLKQTSYPGEARLNKYMDWLSYELGASYSANALHKKIEIDSALLEEIAKSRNRLETGPLEEWEPIDRGFYDLQINRWFSKAVTNIDLNDRGDKTTLENYRLYQTFSAARLWEDVTASEDYDLPGYCRKGLEAILDTPTFNTFTKKTSIFFELGTGAPAKTELILKRLRTNRPRLAHHFIWVDASTPMLEYNVAKVEFSDYAPLQFHAVSTDFEKVKDMLEYLDLRWPDDHFWGTPKCYFLLGFTLSNLDEASFIQKYAAECERGDLLIFPMQFIPASYASTEAFAGIEQSACFQELIDAYNSQEGEKLVRAGLSQIKGQTRELSARAQPIKSQGGLPSADCIGRSVVIRYMAQFWHLNRGNREEVKSLEIIKATRYFESDFRLFVERHGFAFREEIPTAENVKTFLIEFVGRTKDSHNGGGTT